MFSFQRKFRSSRGQALAELTLFLPFLIALGLGALEVANIVNAHLVLTHLSREGANTVSREGSNPKGSSAWATNVNTDLSTIINGARPVIKNTTAAQQAQWKLIYSMIVWNPAPGACPGGNLANGQPDNYRIQRSASAGWAASPNWTYGSLSRSSNIGADGTCASATLGSSIKGLTTTGLTFHVVEIFYDYAPSKLTPVQNFISALTPSVFYTRTIFMG